MDIKDQVYTIKGDLMVILRDAKTGRIKSKDVFKNMFVTVGKNSFAAAFAGVTANNQGIATYCAVGTSVVAPALADIALLNEIFRKAISVRSSNNNVATFQTFYTTSEANGALREAGLFGDLATALTNSGTLFCRAAINRTKSSSDTLSISWAVTIG